VRDGKNCKSKTRFQPNRMPQSELKPKDLVGIPGRVAFALQADGWCLRRDHIWRSPTRSRSRSATAARWARILVSVTNIARHYFYAEAIKVPAPRRRGRRLPRAALPT
jgi:hypothetical protein